MILSAFVIIWALIISAYTSQVDSHAPATVEDSQNGEISQEVNFCLPVRQRTENNSVNSANICYYRWASARRFDLCRFDLPLILIITIPRAAAELDDVGIFKASTEVLGVLLDNGFALNGFLGREGSAFC